jgi:ATP-dependent helicase/nuclease subunit B
MERWHKSGGRVGELVAIAQEELAAMQAHAVTRSLWWPRLSRGLEWVDTEISRDTGEGRVVLKSEIKGEILLAGVKVHGRADRIDRRADGRLVVVDYKTGKPPSAKQVKDGYALQLGTLGLIAAAGGFPEVSGDPDGFEYWSLAKRFVAEPIPENGKRGGIPRAEFLSETRRFLTEAIADWIKGDQPFTARKNPDLGGYNDYDQLMRLDEWQARSEVQE